MIKIFLCFILLISSNLSIASEYIAVFKNPINYALIRPYINIDESKAFGPNNRFLLFKSDLSKAEIVSKLSQYRYFMHLSKNDKISIPPSPTFNNMSNTNSLWWQNNISLSKAHEITMGDKELIVAVIDTGVDYLHQDMKDNILINENEIPRNNIDDDLNGKVDDYYGFDFYDNHGSAMDDNGHGTHCAGLIASNGKFKGVAPNIKILPIKFLNNYGQGDIAKAIDAISYAIERGAKILSNSYGNPNSNQAFLETLKYAEEKNTIFLAAAGNAKNDNDARGEYPANYHLGNVLSVASLSSNNQKSNFSNYGQLSVDLFAPGENILSLDVNNGYKVRSGTSMATPIAAGIAALIWSYFPDKTNSEVIEILLKSTNKQKKLYKYAQNSGRSNAFNALEKIFPPENYPFPITLISEIDAVLNSDSPYENNSTKKYEMKFPEALKISVHFSLVDIENGYDYLQIENSKGNILKKITGKFGPSYTEFFDTNELIFRIVSDDTKTAIGFNINKVRITKEN